MILLLILVVYAVRLALLALAAWVTMLNVNDIASYYMAGADAPFWPFFWIGLFLGLLGFSFSFKTTTS